MGFPIAAALAAIPAIGNLITGGRQRREARNLKPRGVSQELIDNKNKMQAMANAGTDTIQSGADAEIDQQVSNTTNQVQRGSTSSGNVLNAVSAISGNANRAKRNSLADFLRRRRESQFRLGQAESSIANEKRFNDSMYAQAKAQLLGASQMNTASGLENLTTVGLQGFLDNKQQ